MKTVRVRQFGGPEVMQVEESPEFLPGKDQVVVQIHAAGVNPVDLYCRAGLKSWISLPYTPGFDGAGVITKIGPEVHNRKVGDRVYTAFPLSGTYAEEVLCESGQVFPLPQNISLEEGAGVFIPYGTAYRALFQRCKIQPGETILIHGASGAVGIAATQFAVAAGCIVIGTAGTDQGRKLVFEQGAHHVLDHHDKAHFQQALDLTHGRGLDSMIELVSANVGRDVTILAKGGRIAIIGDRTKFEVDPEELTDRDAVILGTNIGNIPPETVECLHADIYAGLKNGTLKPVIRQAFPLAEAGKAHETLSQPGMYGKFVLIP